MTRPYTNFAYLAEKAENIKRFVFIIFLIIPIPYPRKNAGVSIYIFGLIYVHM